MLVIDRITCCFLWSGLSSGWAWCFDVVGPGACGCHYVRDLRSVPCRFGVVFLVVMRDVRGFDVVVLVVLQVVDFPPLLVRNPSVYLADESVDGGIVDAVGDNNHISFPDRLSLSR